MECQLFPVLSLQLLLAAALLAIGPSPPSTVPISPNVPALSSSVSILELVGRLDTEDHKAAPEYPVIHSPASKAAAAKAW